MRQLLAELSLEMNIELSLLVQLFSMNLCRAQFSLMQKWKVKGKEMGRVVCSLMCSSELAGL